MSKVTLNNITGGYAAVDLLNENFDAIEAAFDNTLSRNGAVPNTWLANQDANHKRLLNLADPIDDKDAVNKEYVVNAVVDATPIAFAKAAYYVDRFTGDGSDITFTLTAAPGLGTNSQVYINGAYQNKNTYSISGTTLTFTEAPPNNSDIEVVVVQPIAPEVNAASNITIADAGNYYSSGYVEGALQEIGAELQVISKESINYLWAGELGAWPMGHGATTKTTQRVQCPAGVTSARTNFTEGVVVFHVTGTNRADALRVQRTETDTETASAVVVMNLTAEETKPLRGKQCTLQFNGLKSSEYSGNSIFYRVQYSIEQEQPILNADGTYTNGNTNLVSSSVVLETTAQADTNLFNATFTVPSKATQVSVVFTIPFSGTAGNADYVDLEAVSITLGSKLTALEPIPFEDLLQKAATRYQSTYNYGVGRGGATQQGAVQAVAINTNTNWAFAINVDFSPKMALPPQFLFQSPTSGTESRLLDVDAGTNINGLAFNLNDSGVTITNNGAVTAGNRYLCHWTAQVIL